MAFLVHPSVCGGSFRQQLSGEDKDSSYGNGPSWVLVPSSKLADHGQASVFSSVKWEQWCLLPEMLVRSDEKMRGKPTEALTHLPAAAGAEAEMRADQAPSSVLPAPLLCVPCS